MAGSPTGHLLRQTRRRLFVRTLLLLILLVVGVGATTLVVGLEALDADVDRALETAVQAQVVALDGKLPSSKADHDDRRNPPSVANTVMLVLDRHGGVVLNPSGLTLPGLPDLAGVAAAGTSPDLRTVATGQGDVRVLTVAMDHDDEIAGYVQGAFPLGLHDQQSRSLVLAVLAVGALGLVAAAAITLVVTDRALVPIREGFDTQRRFVADASHELRTPAALIRANAEVLQREGLVAEDGRDLLDDVITEAGRLGSLVGDLVQLAAWEETRLVLVRTPLDVAEVARGIVRNANALATERGLRLVVDAAGPAPAIVDRDRLVQLILILVDNAFDHSPADGQVTVRVRRLSGTILIEVDDEGPGVSESDRERIFEPFTRLAGTTRHGSGGTGLGLAIARRIVEAHGGTIAAGSPPGGGARFTVTLRLGGPTDAGPAGDGAAPRSNRAP